MAEVVDSIVAELIAKTSSYEAGFDRAIAKHKEFTRSLPKIGAMGGISEAEAQQYANRHARAAGDVAKSEESATIRVAKTRKARAVSAKASDEAEVASAKAAAKEKLAAERAAAREAAQIARQAAREKLAVEKAAAVEAVAIAAKAAQTEENSRRRTIGTYGDNPGLRPAKGGRIGAAVPNERHGQSSIPASVLAGAGASEVVAEEAAVNHLLADRATLQASLSGLRGREKAEVREILESMRLEAQLRTAGIGEEEILLRLEERRALVATERAVVARKQASAGTTRGVEQFARGAGAYAALGGAPAVAGLALAAGIAVTAAAISSAVAYGKALENQSKALGINIVEMQAYNKIAADTGVSQEQLTSAFGQFAANLGRAQEGTKEQAKVFKALGIDIKGFASAGDALPTVIDRLSKVADPAQRAALETRLFGEQGRKLDQLLSGGPEKVSALARSLQETGQALSAKEIQELDQTARKMAEIKNQLSVDLSKTVAANSDAIIGLANSFGILANSILNTIGKLQLFAAAQIRASSLASPDDKKLARQYAMSTHAGRLQLYAENNRDLADARAGNGSFNVTGARSPADLERQRKARVAQLVAEHNEIVAADRAEKAAGTTTPVQGGAINPRLLHSLGASPGPKGPSAEALAREAEARTKAFNDRLAQLHDDQLRAQAQLTGSIEERARFDRQLLDEDTARKLADIESTKRENLTRKGVNARLEEARAAELVAAVKSAAATQALVIDQDKQAALAQAATQAAETALSAQSDLLNSQLALATTAKERRDIELRLLANAKEQERTSLQGIIKSAKPGDPAAADAQARLGTLDSRYGAQADVVRDRNKGPLASYLDSLPKTMDQVGEAVQNSAVTALQSLNSELDKSIQNFLHLHGAAGQFIADLIRIGLEHELLKLLDGKGGSPGAAGGGNSGGFFSSIAAAATSIFGGGSSGHRASGGNVVGGRSYLVGEHGPEVVRMGGSGSVYPNGALSNVAGGGGMTVVQHISVDGRNSVTPEGFAREIISVANAHANRVALAAGQGAVQAGPGYQARRATFGN